MFRSASNVTLGSPQLIDRYVNVYPLSMDVAIVVIIVAGSQSNIRLGMSMLSCTPC